MSENGAFDFSSTAQFSDQSALDPNLKVCIQGPGDFQGAEFSQFKEVPYYGYGPAGGPYYSYGAVQGPQPAELPSAPVYDPKEYPNREDAQNQTAFNAASAVYTNLTNYPGQTRPVPQWTPEGSVTLAKADWLNNLQVKDPLTPPSYSFGPPGLPFPFPTLQWIDISVGKIRAFITALYYAKFFKPLDAEQLRFVNHLLENHFREALGLLMISYSQFFPTLEDRRRMIESIEQTMQTMRQTDPTTLVANLDKYERALSDLRLQEALFAAPTRPLPTPNSETAKTLPYVPENSKPPYNIHPALRGTHTFQALWGPDRVVKRKFPPPPAQ